MSFSAATQFAEEISALAERLGDRRLSAQATSGLVEAAYLSGRWGRALGLLESLIEQEDPNTHWALVARAFHALVRLARGDSDGALAESAAYLEFSRAGDDARTTWNALALHGRVLVCTGSGREGAALVHEVVERWRGGQQSPLASPPVWLFDLQAALVRLDRLDEVRPLLEREPRSTPWLEASKLFARRDFVGAADAYERLGALTEEAFARLQAARALTARGKRAEATFSCGRRSTFTAPSGRARTSVRVRRCSPHRVTTRLHRVRDAGARREGLTRFARHPESIGHGSEASAIGTPLEHIAGALWSSTEFGLVG